MYMNWHWSMWVQDAPLGKLCIRSNCLFAHIFYKHNNLIEVDYFRILKGQLPLNIHRKTSICCVPCVCFVIISFGVGRRFSP